jgi:hypothetical protein
MQCPKCGGKTGFVMTQITRAQEFITWDGRTYYVKGTYLRENKRVQCNDCEAFLKITPEIEMLIINRDG